MKTRTDRHTAPLRRGRRRRSLRGRRRYPAAFTVGFPDIVVEQPAATLIADGGTKSLGTMILGTPLSVVFTLNNPGAGALTGLTITKDGADAADLTVTASPAAPVLPGGSTTFTIQFAATTSVAKTAAIHIANNVTGKDTYDITLTGTALSFTEDTDGDGMNDASEFQMSTLGFNWQASQPALVNTYTASANGAGCFTPTQVQSLPQAGLVSGLRPSATFGTGS